MRFDRLPAPTRLGLYGLAVAVLLYLCLAPTRDLPKVTLWDKAEHAIAWFVLATVGFVLFPARVGRVVVFAVALGGIVELLQGALPTGRDMDWKDWVADSAGVTVALAGWMLAQRRRV